MPAAATIVALVLTFIAAKAEGGGVVSPWGSRASVGHQETCSENDIDCWNRNTVFLVNKFRESNGKGPLVLGPSS